MKKLALTSLLLSALAFNAAFAAGKTEPANKEFQAIEANLRKNNPDIPYVKTITSTGVQGIYEVVLNESDIIYTDKDGKFLFFGSLIESRNGQKFNLTEEKVQQLTQLDFKKLNFADAVTRKVGNGKNVVVVFEDPNCGFCKKLQPELAKLTNVTIHTFIIPILGESSVEVAKAVTCSKNPAKEWDNYFKTGVAPTVATLDKCNTSSLDRNIEFARKHKINGTPAMFFSNGRSIKGYAPYAKITEAMSAAPLKK